MSNIVYGIRCIPKQIQWKLQNIYWSAQRKLDYIQTRGVKAIGSLPDDDVPF